MITGRNDCESIQSGCSTLDWCTRVGKKYSNAITCGDRCQAGPPSTETMGPHRSAMLHLVQLLSYGFVEELKKKKCRQSPDW